MRKFLAIVGVIVLVCVLNAHSQSGSGQQSGGTNALTLNGATFAAPGPIGSTTASTGSFTTLAASGASTLAAITGTTIGASGQISSTLATGTAPLSVASVTPVTTMVVANHAQIQFCGTTVACSHTALTGSQVVFGSAPLSSGTPSTAVITGISPAFTSATSYKCLAADVTTITNNVVVVTYSSGSSFTVNGPATNTDTVEYICAGN